MWSVMGKKSVKIWSILLAVLFIGFICAAAYFLMGQSERPPETGFNAQIADIPHQTETSGFSRTPDQDSSLPPAVENETREFADTTATRQERPEPRQVPRQLTEEQKEENLRELARMAEALPDNMWVPKNPTPGFSPERGERLRKSIELSDKIRKGAATSEQQREYYAFKLKETTDKIALIRYIARRTEELSGESGKTYLTQSDINTGEERIEELEVLARQFEQKLSELEPPATD